jgi:FkbM family methyltransferase
MTLITSLAFVAARRLLRSSGLAAPIGRLLNRGGYEARFNEAIKESIRPGDRVWDVGANVGVYTVPFSRWCGDAGCVFAFEPSPSNFARLATATAGLANVKTFQLGLSEANGTASFKQGDDDLGATSHISVAAAVGRDVVTVALRSGDGLVADAVAQVPNVMKIDVESHEFEVLKGCAQLLRNPDLRNVFVEVHFEQLDCAGRADVPAKIVALLEASGLRVRWTDASHIHAGRT